MLIKRSFLLFMGIVSLALLAGCSSADRQSTTFSSPALSTRVSKPAALLEINSIAVLPLVFDVNVRHIAGTEIEASLYSNLESVLRNEMDIQILSGQSLAALGDFKPTADHTRLIEIARNNQTDSVLLTQLHSYSEKVGTEFSASSPAMVDFSMSLFHADSSRFIWQATYHFKDQALSDNILRLQEYLYAKRGARWMTAIEIWHHGLELAVQDLSLRRTLVFEGPEE